MDRFPKLLGVLLPLSGFASAADSLLVQSHNALGCPALMMAKVKPCGQLIRQCEGHLSSWSPADGPHLLCELSPASTMLLPKALPWRE